MDVGPSPPEAGLAPRFDVSATYRASSAYFAVYYDNRFGASTGGSLADGVLARCDIDYLQVSSAFGPVTPPLPMTCVIYTGAGGYHHTCIDNVLYVTGYTLAPPKSPDVTTALAVLVAEAAEVFQAAQGAGWNCADTNGEGLSRVLAEELYPGAIDYYHTADKWLDGGRPDYVSNNIGNDQNRLSNGCSVVFLYYLRYILGYDWPTIVQAGGSTLEQTYHNLTGNSGGYNALRAYIDPRYPVGTPSGLTQDNPFPAVDAYLLSVSLM
jgi:hypothetical protein